MEDIFKVIGAASGLEQIRTDSDPTKTSQSKNSNPKTESSKGSGSAEKRVNPKLLTELHQANLTTKQNVKRKSLALILARCMNSCSKIVWIACKHNWIC
ncbi:TPA: hypothetical protein ACJ5QC_000168 [Enterobacter hormaechei]|uniref:hypothetical protein n=1 Tax=Enterobacter sp. MV-xx2-O TaxID=2886641 RepID=UPI001F3FE320|nr:hypothetical protein [Enterobacter sp. MV-xx2-O]MCF2448782.1 hypothetical protein [Enterobacter sp. MV-xx2-O]